MSTTRRKPMRWRKRKREFMTDRPSYELRRGGEGWLAIVSQLPDGRWYWYGSPGGVHVNTSRQPTTLEACKAAAMEAFRGAEKCRET